MSYPLTVQVMDAAFCLATVGPHVLILARGHLQKHHVAQIRQAVHALGLRHNSQPIAVLAWVSPRYARMQGDVRHTARHLLEGLRDPYHKSAIVVETHGPLKTGVRALATLMAVAPQWRTQRVFSDLAHGVDWLCDSDAASVAPLLSSLTRLQQLQQQSCNGAEGPY